DEKYHKIRMNAVDENFLPAMDIALIDGRNFQKDNSADHTGGAIVNEAFVKEFGLTDPIGKKLPGRFKEQVIGVVKDFNFESLHTKIEPLVLTMKWDSMLRYTEDVMFSSSTEPRVSVRMAGGDLNDNILLLQNAWKKIVPNQNFDYHFLDESLAAQYREDQRVSKIILVASALAIFIACMGLFGLATLVVNRRTKEIGIRKILGAGYASIISLVSKDFVVIVIIAAVIAFPLAFYAMDKWLQNFEYRTVIRWWIFLLAAIVALVVTRLTVGFHAMRVAVSNPVKNLSTE
ncbi:MAG TPA: ABC transporter permease, partial [Chitinophagales bacterium]|nr:ABC transporter permease [Chitinophagales bacterium]